MRTPSLLSLSELKEILKIPPEDTSKDTLLQEIEIAETLDYERRYYVRFGPEGFIRLRGSWPIPKRQQANGTINVIVQGLQSLGRYKLLIGTDEWLALEKRYLEGVADQALTHWQQHPDDDVSWLRWIAVREANGFLCHAIVETIVRQKAFEVRFTEAGWSYLSGPHDYTHTREFQLVFARPSRTARIVRIFVRWGSERKPTPLQRGLKKHLASRGLKLLYFSTHEPKSSLDIIRAYEDACTQVCLYLLREGMLDLDEDLEVRNFLSRYFERRFPFARRVGGIEVASALMKASIVPESYRVFRRYVSRTIRRLFLNEKKKEFSSYRIPDPEGARELLLVHGAAAELEISPQALHYRIKQGEVRTKTVDHNGSRYLTIPEEEVERLEKELAEERLRKAIIAVVAQQRDISEASALRRVERKEKQGWGLKEFVDHLGREEMDEARREIVVREQEKRRKRGRIKRRSLVA